MLTRFARRQLCASIADHRQAHDFSQSFRAVYVPDRLHGSDDAQIASGTPTSSNRSQPSQVCVLLGGRSVPFVTGQPALVHALSNAFTPVDLADMPSNLRAVTRHGKTGPRRGAAYPAETPFATYRWNSARRSAVGHR